MPEHSRCLNPLRSTPDITQRRSNKCFELPAKGSNLIQGWNTKATKPYLENTSISRFQTGDSTKRMPVVLRCRRVSLPKDPCTAPIAHCHCASPGRSRPPRVPDQPDSFTLPKMLFSLDDPIANSSMFVFPMTIAPGVLKSLYDRGP